MIHPMRVAVLLNPSSGPKREGISESAIRGAFQAVSIQPEIIPLTSAGEVNRHLAERVRAGFHSIVAAGGDGTVNLAGAAVAGTSTALGVLAAGTFNHFAKDMRLP